MSVEEDLLEGVDFFLSVDSVFGRGDSCGFEESDLVVVPEGAGGDACDGC